MLTARRAGRERILQRVSQVTVHVERLDEADHQLWRTSTAEYHLTLRKALGISPGARWVPGFQESSASLPMGATTAAAAKISVMSAFVTPSTPLGEGDGALFNGHTAVLSRLKAGRHSRMVPRRFE